MAFAIEVEHLTKRFGDRVAFEDVTFTVSSGEVFGFLGPNGAGKTTTVRTLGTLIHPTSGSARIAGVPLNDANATEIRKRITIMPESPGLYLRLTVFENLEFFAGLYGVRNPKARIDASLESVNLASRSNDVSGTLSKGLRQRVGIARALLSEPAVIFLDEPTSGLDPVATREVNELIALLRERNVTVFLTTHRLEEAERLCDRVAILNTKLVKVGKPDELRRELFSNALEVITRTPVTKPDRVFTKAIGVRAWHSSQECHYTLEVNDPTEAAPSVARALVRAGSDIIKLGESHRSLEDVFLELVDQDVEAGGR
ncbi:MAG: ABC transporter ATP-binding protein [Actinomycetota bacterium]